MRNATARAVSAEVTVISEDAAARPLGARTTPRPSTPARTSSTATEDLLVGIRDRESRHQPQHNGTTLRQPQLPPTGLPRCPLQLHLQRSHEGDGGTSITTASATGSTCILIGYLLGRSSVMSHEIVDGCVSGRDLDRQRDTFPGHRTLPEANSPRNRESARGFHLPPIPCICPSQRHFCARERS